MSFHYTSILCFWNFVGCIVLRFSFLKADEGPLVPLHCRVHVHFQISPRALHNYFAFFVFPHQLNRCHSIIEHYRVSTSRFAHSCFSLFLSDFTNFGPHFRPHIVWSFGHLNFCLSPSRPHISPLHPVQESEKTSIRVDIPLIINSFFSCTTSRFV